MLHFTFELAKDNTIPFLDVLVEAANNEFITSVYRKPTNTGQTLNAKSECPTRYKTSVIRSFVRRAIRTSSSHEKMHAEFVRLKQLLVNNGYSNHDVDSEIKRQLDNKYTDKTSEQTQTVTHHLYYRNHMNSQYETDEKILKSILKRNIKCKENHSINLHIYYQNTKTKNLVMCNNPVETKWLMRTNVVYQFQCPDEGCRLRKVNYIGYTSTTLSRRLTMHLQEGAPKDHLQQEHNTTLTRKMLTDNTRIIHSNTDHNKIEIIEAIYINQLAPHINTQKNVRLAKLSLWGIG